MKCVPCICLLLLMVIAANGATYFVRTDGADNNDGLANNPDAGGTANQAWLTIGKAESTMVAGDTVRVADGTYNERVTCTGVSGTEASWINYVGNATGTGVVMRGFTFTDVHHIRVIGFEITHVNTLNRAGVHMTGTATSNIMVLDNYIHDVHREGMHVGNAKRVTVRGNSIYYIAHPGSTQDPDVGLAADSGSTQNLIEYNRLQRCSDFIDWYGPSNVFRNLWMHDTDPPTYWNDIDTHPDFFQPGSDGQQTFTRHHLIEAVFMGDNRSEHGHGFIFQDNSGFGDTNLTGRGCVLYETDGGGMGGFGTEYVQLHNNTLFNNLTVAAPPIGNLINWYRDGVDGSMGGLLISTMIAFVAPGHDDIYLDVDNEVLRTNNWGYAANSEADYVSTANPLFVDTNALDFRLQSGSGARGVGRHLTTITNANGSGTSFGVPDKHRLKDGLGICEGDVISFPGGGTARITAVDYETHVVTVASSITWTNGQRVYWGPLGHQADIGAYPFGAAFLTAATMLRSGTTYTVTPSGDARGVWFYVDGIPATWDYDAPYQTTIASGAVTAKAYALYAQTWPVVNATDLGESGSNPYRNKGRASRSAGVIP